MGLFRALRENGYTGRDVARGVRRALRPVSPHGDIEVEDTDNALSVGRLADAPPFLFLGMGRITDEGPDEEPDFEDPRYWFEWLQPVATRADGSLPTAGVWAFAFQSFQYEGTGIVYNLPETAREVTNAVDVQVKGCHLLGVGDQVAIYATVDDKGFDRLVCIRDPSPITVHITGTTGCGKGFYTATATKRPTADIDKSVDLTSASIGAAGPAVIVRNLQEINRASASAWLTAAANTDQLDFAGGRLAYVNADGTAVIDFNALWLAPCTTSPPPPPP